MSEIVPANNSVLASFIERASRDDSFDVAKFGELLRMQREVEHDQARKAFNRAMAAAQAEMLPVVRDAKNSHLNNKYAKLETIDAAIRPIYTAHGFSVRYGSAPAPNEGWMRITCTVAHDGGYFEENYLDAPVTTTGSQGGRMAITPVQAIGSTVTYLRRYLLGMVWNTVMADVDDDDDGEGMRRTAAAATTPRAPRVTEPRRADPSTPVDPLDLPLGHEWLVALKKALEAAGNTADVTTIGGHASVNDALSRDDTPPKVKRQITELLADAYAKHAEATTDAADPDAAGEPELPPVEIAGAKYVGSGLMSDDLADIALSKILGERDDVAGERLVNLFNSVRPQTVATTVTACAQIMGSVLAECPEEVREDFWRAFEKLTFGCMKIKQGLH